MIVIVALANGAVRVARSEGFRPKRRGLFLARRETGERMWLQAEAIVSAEEMTREEWKKRQEAAKEAREKAEAEELEAREVLSQLQGGRRLETPELRMVGRRR